MKVSLNWLRGYVDLPPTTEALVSLLTMAGIEVEGIETTGCAIANVVVAQINSSEQHPNADRLSVCQVDDGSRSTRQIVCGAKNYQVGFTEPFLFDRPITAGIDVFNQEIQYIGQFTQASKGMNTVWGFPAGPFSRYFVSYSYQNVRVKDLNPYYSQAASLASRRRVNPCCALIALTR